MVERLGEAFSFGYARYLDFRSLEQRNRALQIGRAVANVQSAVAAMTSSADIVRVILLLTRELEELELEFMFCSISLVDEERNQVRSFNTPRYSPTFDMEPVRDSQIWSRHSRAY